MNNSCTLVILRDGTRVVFKMNQAFRDTYSSQTKALLATHQVCDFGASITNCAKCHQRHDDTPGTQSIVTPEDTFEFYFYGKNDFFKYLNRHKRA